MATLVSKQKWRSFLAVLLSGLCLGLSQPLVISFFSDEPLGSHGLLGLLSLIGYAPIIYLLPQATAGRAFRLSFVASLIHFSITFYWLIIAMTVFGGISLFISASILVIMSAVLACYIGSAFAIAQFLHLRFRFAHYLVVPACVCAVEYLRNYGFVGGFPWGNIGYGLSQVSVFLQTASLVGIYGLVFIVVMLNALIAELAWNRFDIFKVPRRRLLVFIVLFGGMVSFGVYRLSLGYEATGKTLRVALLQGNIEQGIKNKAAVYADEIIRRYQRLQDEAVSRKADLVIWPESGYPLAVPTSMRQIKRLGEPALVTVVGAVAYGNDAFHNSAFVLDENFEIKARYDKSHLVPFGEYVPWPFATVAKRLVPGLGAFYPGNEYKPAMVKIGDLASIGLGLTICYEGVFPEIARTHAKNGADILVNLTNDAWYGVSSAPYQHLHMYRLRSVETGLPFVRATNTGSSAWVDNLGFVHDPTKLYEQAIVIADVPLAKRQTLYMLVGDVVPQLCLIFVLFAWILGLVGKDVFMRKRDLIEWILGGLGIALVFWASWHYAEAKAALDESALTKQTFVTAYGLALLGGAWSGRKSGRKALIVASIVLMLLSFFVGLAEDPIYWTMTVLTAVVAFVAFKREKAFE